MLGLRHPAYPRQEEEVRLPWGHGLSTYSKFVADVVPARLAHAGAMGLDADHERRLGVPDESVALGTRAASSRYLRALSAVALPAAAAPAQVNIPIEF
jgi:hypothetical protein